jgi:VWD domain-containing protein/repulsive guidance molecule (RGM) protein
MSKKKLLAILLALAVLIGLPAALRWLWPWSGTPPVIPVTDATNQPAPPPIRGLIREVSERDDVAHSNGDVHIRTADGAYYDFQLVGEFIALKARAGDLEVQIRQEPWQGASRTVSTNTAVAVNVAGDRVSFYMRPRTKLVVNGEAISSLNQPLALPRGGKVVPGDGSISIVSPDESEVRVTPHGGYLDLVVELARARNGKVAGLFGNFDGNPANDFAMRDGRNVELPGPNAAPLSPKDFRKKLYDDFGSSWRIGQAESMFEYDAGESVTTFADLKFPYELVSTATLDQAARSRAEDACKQAGVTDPGFLDNCVLDVAATGDTNFTKSAVRAQEEIKLRVGFQCRDIPDGGDKCTNFEPSLADARIGSAFSIEIETKTGDQTGLESFNCSLVDPSRKASCIIRTKGKVFAGAKVTRRYTLESGAAGEIKGEMRPR